MLTPNKSSYKSFRKTLKKFNIFSSKSNGSKFSDIKLNISQNGIQSKILKRIIKLEKTPKIATPKIELKSAKGKRITFMEQKRKLLLINKLSKSTVKKSPTAFNLVCSTPKLSLRKKRSPDNQQNPHFINEKSDNFLEISSSPNTFEWGFESEVNSRSLSPIFPTCDEPSIFCVSELWRNNNTELFDQTSRSLENNANQAKKTKNNTVDLCRSLENIINEAKKELLEERNVAKGTDEEEESEYIYMESINFLEKSHNDQSNMDYLEMEAVENIYKNLN